LWQGVSRLNVEVEEREEERKEKRDVSLRFDTGTINPLSERQMNHVLMIKS
jgi:hypothetical protein